MARFRLRNVLLLCGLFLIVHHLSQVPLAGLWLYQGYYGRLATFDDTTALEHRLPDVTVCVFSDAEVRALREAERVRLGWDARSGFAPPPKPDHPGSGTCARSDGNGVYSVKALPGPKRICVDLGNDSFACDPCQLQVHPGQTFRRDFTAGPGGGTWGGDVCREQLSI